MCTPHVLVTPRKIGQCDPMYERVIVAQLEVTLAQGGPPAGTNYYFKRGVLEVLKCEVAWRY